MSLLKKRCVRGIRLALHREVRPHLRTCVVPAGLLLGLPPGRVPQLPPGKLLRLPPGMVLRLLPGQVLLVAPDLDLLITDPRLLLATGLLLPSWGLVALVILMPFTSKTFPNSPTKENSQRTWNDVLPILLILGVLNLAGCLSCGKKT